MSKDTELRILEIAVSDFDVSQLPAQVRLPGTPVFQEAIRQFYQERLGRVVDSFTVKVDSERIRVSWRVSDLRPNAVDEAVSALTAGDYKSGILMLELLAPSREDDPVVHYNLGMAYSDQGKLHDAVTHLKKAVELQPDHTNAMVALGVAYSRQRRWEEAAEILGEAVRKDPNNPWAHRNLGGVLLTLGIQTDVALASLQQATILLPEDQQAWLGLAQAQMATDDNESADDSLLKVIEIQPFTKFAEMAKDLRSKIAALNFRAIGGDLRMDAIMYCLSALKTFATLNEEKVRQIGFEIAILGMKGIDVNNPRSSYQLKSLPGSFSGLHLLCIQYTAFQQVEPDMDMGFDVSREYQEAKQMLAAGL
jgi:tetratricopeptide (TPR) repeat protein